ncbi:nuclear transport factor 2 family protein [Vagococcus sp. WN89Y]|uniref:nuclear transport factor 2 family protein n=1 Tax=Vagococcus sp. WN89Y TaxID=3457258 RepID=UPI003FCD0091
MNNIQHVAQALREIICHPEHSEAKIRDFFSADYQQYVDGETLDFAGFVSHMATLKRLTQAMDIELVAIAGQSSTVLTHHIVTVKKEGQQSRIEVFAHFTLRDGLIIRCEELTRLVAGAAQDRLLGSLR